MHKYCSDLPLPTPPPFPCLSRTPAHPHSVCLATTCRYKCCSRVNKSKQCCSNMLPTTHRKHMRPVRPATFSAAQLVLLAKCCATFRYCKREKELARQQGVALAQRWRRLTVTRQPFEMRQERNVANEVDRDICRILCLSGNNKILFILFINYSLINNY